MNTDTSCAAELLELANRYPSPHNGQPVRLRQVTATSFDMYFQKERGLQSTDISYIFSYVSMGVFVQHMAYCAQALGHGYEYDLVLPPESELHGEGTVKFAACRLEWNKFENDEKCLNALRFRQTSRKKYYEGVPAGLARNITDIAHRHNMILGHLEGAKAREAVWLNQRAVFDDMFDEPVRKELNHWLRYTAESKQEHMDGLAYDCLELNGGLLRYIVNHPKVLRSPLVAPLIKQYYMRTMSDSSDVFYMLAPFGGPGESFAVGTVIMKIWQEISAAGLYLHPFGTIMSNKAAHRDFAKLAEIENENRQTSYLVFIFRAGRSARPEPSMRIPYQKHLVMEHI